MIIKIIICIKRTNILFQFCVWLFLIIQYLLAGRGTTALKSKNDQTAPRITYFIVGKYLRGWPIVIIRRYNVCI